jgi:FtsP/CotA-like multicopper oxidase with cupredoxin domain
MKRFACIAVALAAIGAHAQSSRIVTSPPPLTPALQGAPGTSGEFMLDLDIAYRDATLWNPASGRDEPVRLRAYLAPGMGPDDPIVSPMIAVTPGTTLRIRLNNRLPDDPGCDHASGDVNVPHCLNGTNLHTHGLWVNPAGNGDNVLISVNPGMSFDYEHHVASDHPAGTFWYHTHRHGSTALQVSSGMAGALIVRGDRLPSFNANGDLDTLLRHRRNTAFTERVVILQQIQYACRDAQGGIKVNADKTYRCDPGDIGGIEGYDQIGFGTWPASGRYTSINGRILPTFAGAATGVVERWRMIHGGVRDTINLEFRKLRADAPGADLLSTSQLDQYVAQQCDGPPLTQHLVAADGLTMAAVMPVAQTVFQPAYRWDALMVFPEAGTYCVIDAAAPPAGTIDFAPPSRQLLAFVSVEQGRAVPGADVTAFLESELVAAAARNMPHSVRDAVIADLRSGMKLTRFVPHPDVRDDEITGTQQLVFNIDTSLPQAVFQVDGKPYDPARIDRALDLGAVEEWTLASNFASHPFHIHVNPFQVVSITDPNGKDVSAPGAVDDAGGLVDLQYRGLKGIWKDTIWVKSLVPPGSPPGRYTVKVRTRYQRYIGDFVLHCHILDHEDRGMMQNVRVALPGGGAHH